MSHPRDITILRDLAKRYAGIAADPVQDERRRLWSDHHDLKPVRTPFILTFGMWNVWCRETFGDARMECQDPFYRAHERTLRMQLFHATLGDDMILEPWLTQGAAVTGEWERMWGVFEGHVNSTVDGGAWRYDPPIKDWSDLAKLRVTHHQIDEDATTRNVAKLHDAVGDIIAVDVPRTPSHHGFASDISTDIAKLRGLQTLMMDMYESPAEVHRLLAFMRDGILANNREAEQAGDYSLSSQINQALPYGGGPEWPRANAGPRKRKDLWTFCASQEFTLISPAFHEEFLLRYQMPIITQFGPLHYGCCENLTSKIDLLRTIPNLRSIAVAPLADVRACAEKIGRDYVLSWRPNPTEVICAGWDEPRIRRVIGDGLRACRENYMHIHMKDVETLEGDISRPARWCRLVREEIDRAAAV